MRPRTLRTPEAPLFAQDDWLKMHIIQHNKTLVATTTVSQRFITAMFQHNILTYYYDPLTPLSAILMSMSDVCAVLMQNITHD